MGRGLVKVQSVRSYGRSRHHMFNILHFSVILKKSRQSRSSHAPVTLQCLCILQVCQLQVSRKSRKSRSSHATVTLQSRCICFCDITCSF
jgi:hypothetical protein